MEPKISNENNILYEFGPFRLDVGERRLTQNDELLPLPRKAFDLLLILVSEAGHLKTREELIEALWPDTVVEEQGLTTRLYALRKALGDDGSSPVYIETERGIGYRFIAEIKVKNKNPPTRNPLLESTEEMHPRSEPLRRHRRRRVAGVTIFGAVVVAILLWWFLYGEAPSASPSSPSIAVLPFEDLSPDPANAYIVAGIRDTILTRLAQLKTFHVISRTASDYYGSHPKNLARMTQELNINTVLEGSVQKFGKKIMINVQLINAKTHDHIWAATYTRSLNDIFGAESSIATKVATALQSKLHPEQLAQLATPPTQDKKAYLTYLKANYYARKAFTSASTTTPEQAVARAAGLYRQALARDPAFALAWAKLSLLDIRAYWFEIDYSAKRKLAAEKAAKRAVELAPQLPEAHIAQGYAFYYGKRDFAAALHQFQIARSSLPYNANIVGAMAYIHRRQGRWKKSLQELRHAHQLDARNPIWPYETGFTLMVLRRYKAAEQQFNQALAISPNDHDAQVRKISSFLLAGDLAQAQQAVARIPRDIDPQGFVSALRYNVAWLSHQPEKALKILEQSANWQPLGALRANIWALKGDTARARADYEKKCVTLREKLQQTPDNPDLWSALGLAEAGLGNKKKAIEAGRRATKLYPLDKDAIAGPIYLTKLAKIHARLGDAKTATRLLDELLAIPAGGTISVALLVHDPDWNPIRKDTAFQALIKKYGSNAPDTITSASSGPPTSR